MKTVFISNYINHHQIPFSDALYRRLQEDYHFIQTEPMEEERIQMGWALDASRIPYVVFAYEEEERCRRLIEEADLVLAGWTLRTDLFASRLASNRLTLRISERIYREGQWKAISPRGLIAKYREHVRFRKNPVYLLCNGAYVASDFALIHAYPGKMFKFGYFPEMRTYEGDSLFERKRQAAAAGSCVHGDVKTLSGKHTQTEVFPDGCLHMVWAGRMIPLKHPEFVTRIAAELKKEGRDFHIHFIGSGPMEDQLKQEIGREGLAGYFTLYGFLPPEGVREVMEGCRVHLFTSNYLEGWGTVVNEGMNSGCCAVANAQAGAVPFLIEDGVNGLVYEKGRYENFAAKVKQLFEEPASVERMGRAAYRTITEEWNADCAARRCLAFYEGWKKGRTELSATGPLSPAGRLSARWKYDEGKLE